MVRILILLACAVTVTAQLPDAWRYWRFSAPLPSPAVPAGTLTGIVVPPSVTSRSRREWTDLRVIDSSGHEVPFVLHARMGGKTLRRRPVPLLEPTLVKGQYQQAVLDTGGTGAAHNTVRLGVTTNAALLAWVEIAVGTDLKEWRVVQARAPIYVLHAAGKDDNTDVSYPDSASRYLRVRVLDGTDGYKLTSAELGYQQSSRAEYVPAGIELTLSTAPGSRTIWTSQGDWSPFPISRVAFQTDATMFSRQATVEVSDDGERWRPVGGQEIRGAAGGGEPVALAFGFGELYGRAWRVTVLNGNDAPIADLHPQLLMVQRRVLWRPEPGGSYRLLFGNPRAPTPQYDLGGRSEAKALDAAVIGEVGAPVENMTWVDPTPWTERQAAVLWVALIAAVVVLGLVAVQTLRTGAPTNGQSEAPS
jgi:hypothetical protein